MRFSPAAAVAALFVFVFALAPQARAAPPLEAYGKLPGVDMVALAPSGAYYAIVGDVAGERRLAVVAINGKPITVAALDDHKVRDIAWAGDGRLLVFTSEAVGLGYRFGLLKYEVGQLLVLNLLSGENYWAMADGGESGNGVWGYHGVRQIDGQWYAFLGGLQFLKSQTARRYIFKDSHPDLFRLELDTGRTKLIDEDEAGDSTKSWVIGAGGDVEAVLEYDRRDGDWRIRNPARKVIASGHDDFGDTLLAGKGRTEGTVIYRERTDYGEDAWIETRIATGEKLILFRGIRIVQQFRDPTTNIFIGYRRGADHPDNRFFDEVAMDRVRAAALAFPGMNVRMMSWSQAFDRFIVQTDGAGDAGTWWLVDIHTGRAEEIGRSYPQVRADDVGPVRVVKYEAADGLEVEGVLTLPPGREAKDLPVVVIAHDGPDERAYPEFDWLAQAFASRGYAVFQPNFRGSAGYGAEFRDAGKGEWGGKMQTDISDGVAELARQGIVDPRRACIMGQAYGGYAALAGVTLQSGLYRCAVAVAPISDLVKMHTWLGYKHGRVSPGLRRFVAQVGDEHARQAASPAWHAGQADAPVLLIHGKDDTEVPIDQSRLMQKALEAKGKYVRLIELEGEDHWLSREETRHDMLKAAVGFVEKHNPPH